MTAFAKASPVLLEPYMKIEVSIPEEYMGSIIGDLNNRRAHIAGMEAKGKYQIVIAQIPMSETLDYSAFCAQRRVDAAALAWRLRTTRKCRSSSPTR